MRRDAGQAAQNWHRMWVNGILLRLYCCSCLSDKYTSNADTPVTINILVLHDPGLKGVYACTMQRHTNTPLWRAGLLHYHHRPHSQLRIYEAESPLDERTMAFHRCRSVGGNVDRSAKEQLLIPNCCRFAAKAASGARSLMQGGSNRGRFWTAQTSHPGGQGR
jgi:hypothetical protein